MPKKMYSVVDNKFCEIKKPYCVINQRFCKTRRGYTVIDGKYRPFRTGGELAYYGNSEDGAIEPLHSAVSYGDLVSAHIGKYALFNVYSTVSLTGYNDKLTRLLVTGIKNRPTGATETELYAVFDCGNFTAFNTDLTAIDIPISKSYSCPYNTTAGTIMIFQSTNTGYSIKDNLVVSNMTGILSGHSDPGFTSWGDKAVYAGGRYNTSTPSRSIYVVNENLTNTQLTSSYYGKFYLGATTVGEYAILAGGIVYVPAVDVYTPEKLIQTNTVEVLNNNMTKVNASNLSEARWGIGCVTNREIALLGGGEQSTVYGRFKDTVDMYNEKLVHTLATPLSVPRMLTMAETISDFFLFAGGVDHLYYGQYGSSPETTTFVDVYTT